MKGILFTEILFNKTIRKEKTMTRRAPASLKVINGNPNAWKLYQVIGNKIKYEAEYTEKHGIYSCFDAVRFVNNDGNISKWIKPTYKVGEVVYIKEPVAEYHYKVFRDGMVGNLHKPAYKYGMAEHQAVTYDGSTPRIIPRGGLKFQNKMFVGADKARYYIRITNIKCERLYDITDEDCLKEGVEELLIGNGAMKLKEYPLYDNKRGKTTISLRRSFFSLFRFANKVPKSKEIPNIWCFAYSYVLCDINGNE